VDETTFEATDQTIAQIERWHDEVEMVELSHRVLEQRPTLAATAHLRAAARELAEGHYRRWRARHPRHPAHDKAPSQPSVADPGPASAPF
jgi:hypothetical protein